MELNMANINELVLEVQNREKELMEVMEKLLKNIGNISIEQDKKIKDVLRRIDKVNEIYFLEKDND
tara:strand:+ start:385 stop:582 length:198 start_codon:yes stop_codon:yes gene_type:complete